MKEENEIEVVHVRISAAGLLFVIALVVFLFQGSPDITDAIIHYLMK